MTRITLTWGDWRRVIAVLREQSIPHEREHAELLEKQLETHAPGEEMVTLTQALAMCPGVCCVSVVSIAPWRSKYGRFAL